jgi:hypothetical protein
VEIIHRAGALLLVNLVLQVVESLFMDDRPHVGLGLAWFLLCLAVSGYWAHRDARGPRAVRDVVALWAVVAAVVAVGAAVFAALFGNGAGLGTLVENVVKMLPLAVFIVLLPATIGGLLGDRD